MAKINFDSDLSKDLSHLDCILFRTKGRKAAWKRFHFFKKNDRYDDAVLILEYNGKKHCLHVAYGQLKWGWSIETLKGKLNLMHEAKAINLRINSETSKRALAAVGQPFDDIFHAIAHIFCLQDPELADAEVLIDHSTESIKRFEAFKK